MFSPLTAHMNIQLVAACKLDLTSCFRLSLNSLNNLISRKLNVEIKKYSIFTHISTTFGERTRR